MVDVALDAALRQAGSTTAALCSSPAESVAVVAREHPDLILLAATPNNFAEAIEAVQALAQDPEACIIVTTYRLPVEEERQLREAGISGLFKSPFRVTDLIPALEEIFRQHCRRSSSSL